MEQPYTAPAAVEIPRLADADMVIQTVGQILRQDANGIDAAINTITQGKIDNAKFAGKGHCRFRPLFGEYGQPGAGAAGQQHGNGLL
jgi:hypothetical protein